MISQHLRFAALGGLLGLFVALTPACPAPKKCDASTCATGCCTDKLDCVTATTDDQCGTSGAACSACGATDSCFQGACTPDDQIPLPDGGTPDAGPPPCMSDEDCASQPGTTCFPDHVCRPCVTDWDCGELKVCNADGSCGAGSGLHGAACTGSEFCQEQSDNTNPCFAYGLQCACDIRSGTTGTCRVRKNQCQECNTDIECGSEQVFTSGFGVGRCAALDGDDAGVKYCEQKPEGFPCGCGYVSGPGGYCVPQSGSCGAVACNIDNDCPAGNVCSVNRPDAGVNSCGGVCIPKCRWDFQRKEVSAPGCPGDKTCWVDQANLDANSPYFGAGRCLPACNTDADCTVAGGDPWGGPDLVCRGEKLPDGSMSAKRCRARGECMDTLECPVGVSPSKGYCDRTNFTCHDTGCRNGEDPTTGDPFDDCIQSYTCAEDGGVAYCRPFTCVEKGVGYACSRGQYCCGDDKNGAGGPDVCPPADQLDDRLCYKAPAPPFCTKCGDGLDLSGQNPIDPAQLAAANAECQALVSATWGCPQGSGFPNCSPLQARCMWAGSPDGMAYGVNVCWVPTYADTTVHSTLGCPAGLGVEWVKPNTNPDDNGYCQTDDDCSPQGPDGGHIGQGHCEADPEIRLVDGGFPKTCRCDQGSGTSQCPNGYYANAPEPVGVTSFCRDALERTDGGRNACIETAVCRMRGAAVYQPPSNNGCGLQ